MKRGILIILGVLFFNLSYSISPEASGSIMFKSKNQTNTSTIALNKNYQGFKHQVINFESSDYSNLSSYKRRRKKQDNLMLYVAGGLAVATATLILTNNPENFTTNSAGSVNLGIAVGGTLGCGLIVAKYLIDKSR